jgi:uncharacterized membrane protein YfcA
VPPEQLPVLLAGVFAIALLYSSVGHAGASGYIAVMALLQLAPSQIKPTALALNILVAGIATFQFWRAGHFSWPLFWPLAALAIPYAWIGGYASLPGQAFQKIAGLVLLYSAARFVMKPPPEREPTDPPRAGAFAVGGWIGLLAGLTGTGGGIFLTPTLLFLGWARARTAAAVSAPFILVNSLAGLSGNVAATGHLPGFAPALLVAAGLGGAVGSFYGSRRFEPTAIKRLLAAVLLVAGAKLLLT